MNEPEVLRELTNDGILIITLNRPDKMNAINEGLRGGILNAVQESKSNNGIRVLVLTGNGRGFCAGTDISSGGPAKRKKTLRSRAGIADKHGPTYFIETLANASVPLIGAINGAAVGAGLGLALCCDIRIASDKARLGSIYIKRGVGPDYGASYWLPRLVGLPKAFELLYSGELLSAEEAFKIGLVNRVVPHEFLLKETIEYARMIAKGPPLAYTYTRRSLIQSIDNNLHKHLTLELKQQWKLLKTHDAREGFGAFLEHREPKFKGS